MNLTLKNRLDGTANAVIFPVTQDNYETALPGIASETGVGTDWLKENFKAENKEHLKVPGGKNKTIHLLGLGSQPGAHTIYRTFRNFGFLNKNSFSQLPPISFLHFEKNKELISIIEAAVNGLLLGNYEIGMYKEGATVKSGYNTANVTIYVDPSLENEAKAAATKGFETAECQRLVMNMVNAPSNRKTPADMVTWARKAVEDCEVSISVMDQSQIEKEGLHSLLAVNKGSENPPFFIVLNYTADSSPNLPRIGLAGKGVTFDTGGLSIKPSANLHYMKSDMGGAGAVLGAVRLCARLKMKVSIVAVIPVTENSVDALSLKPGDVINSYSGKTIEVIDTDAEGRLILADGLSYLCRNFKPDYLIDVATLTGNAVRVFGYHAGALFSNDEQLGNLLMAAGLATGEKVWRLPLWEEYLEDIKSDIADVKNYSGKPSAGAISAAKFLEAFTDNHPRWAHLDIAGVAFGDTEFGTMKNATGFGVKLLSEAINRISRL